MCYQREEKGVEKEKKKRRRQSELCASNGKEKKIKENKDTVS